MNKVSKMIGVILQEKLKKGNLKNITGMFGAAARTKFLYENGSNKCILRKR